MLDSLDLNAIRQQLDHVDGRINRTKMILRIIAVLFLLLACGALFLGSLELQVASTAARGGASSRTNEDTPETSILSPLASPSCQCFAAASQLAVVAVVNAAIWGLVLPMIPSTFRQSSFAKPRETKEALDQLNIGNPESAPKPTSYLAIIIAILFVCVITLPLTFFFVNIDFSNLSGAISELIKIVIILLVLIALILGYLSLPYALQRRPNNQMHMGKYEQALQGIIQLRRQFPNQIIFIHLQGIILGAMDRGAEAQQCYVEYFSYVRHLNTALTISPVLNNLALEYAMEGNYELAQSMFETGIKLCPPLAHPYHNLGWIYLTSGNQASRAIELIEFGISLMPKQDKNGIASFLSTLAWAYAVSGNQQQAEKTINDALNLVNPQMITSLAQIHYRAGRAKQALGDVEAARIHFSTAATLDVNGRAGHQAQRALDEIP